MTDRLLTTTDVAKRLKISRRQVQTLIKNGRLPAVMIHRDWYIKPDDLALVRHRPRTGRPRKGDKKR